MSYYHIIGDADTVLGYRFAGVHGTIVTTVEEARKAFREAVSVPGGAVRSSAGVLLITEAVEDMISEEVTQHRLSARPPYLAVVQDIWGARGHRKSLQELITEAVGIKLERKGTSDPGISASRV